MHTNLSKSPVQSQRLLASTSQDRFGVLFRTSRDAIMTLEPPKWKFTSGNPAAVKMFNCKNEKEFISLGPWQLSPKRQLDGKESSDKARKMIIKAMEKGSNFFEWTHKRYKGEDFSATVLLSKVTEGKKNYLQATVRDISVAKKIEKELRKSEENFRVLSEASPDCIKLFDTHGKLLYINPSGIKEHHLENSADIANFDFQSTIIKKQKPMIKKVFKEAVEGKVNSIEVEHISGKATGKYCLETFSPIKDSTGKVISVFGVSRDVSEIKKANERISQFADKTRNYLSSLVPTLQRVAIGDFSENIKIPETKDEFTELLVALKLKIGDLRDIKVETEQKSLDLKNAMTATQNVFRDLQAEKELIANIEAKDKALLGSIGEGVVAVDQNGRIILINTVAEKTLGIKAKQVEGKSIFEAWRMTDEKGDIVIKSKHPIEIALKSKVAITTSQSYFYTRSDGTTFPVIMVTSAVVLDNKIIGAVDVFRDVTREKEIDRMKTEFVSIASHQLRTPPTTIRWSMELLLENTKNLHKDQIDLLNTVYESNERMIKLIDALLNSSRMELGTFSVNLEKIRMTELVETVLGDLNIKNKSSNLIFNKSFAENIPEILLDRSLMEIVVLNLMTNAIKYTPSGGKIGVIVAPYKNNSILLSVSDSGCGIPKSQQSEIFKKLFRADNAQQIDPDGTGLGLYLVKSIIDYMDGQITFKSEEGRGTTFSVIIPLSGMKSKEGKTKIVNEHD